MLMEYKKGNKYFLNNELKLFILPEYFAPVIGPSKVFGGNSNKRIKFHNGK